MKKKVLSININNDSSSYIEEQIQKTFSDEGTKYSTNFPEDPIIPGTFVPITDYVKASTGGTFYGKLYYPSTITNFSGLELPTANWVLDRINYYLSNISIDFNTLFDNRFSTKSLGNLAIKSHSLLTDIHGNGDIHLNSIEASRVINPASATTDGYLRKEDWVIFNSKLSYINTGPGLLYSGGTLSLVPGLIDHNLLKNYDPNKHVPKNDSATDSNSLWSAAKIISYVNSIIPPEITDYVSKSNGGVFEGIISYLNPFYIDNNPLNLVYLGYLNNRLITLKGEVFTTLKGTGQDSISNILAYGSISNLGVKDHNLLDNIQGGDSTDRIHLTQLEYNRVAQPATSTTDGYLKKEDWITFNNKLNAFTTASDTLQNVFLRYDNGVLYYNLQMIDHDALLNYDQQKHPLLDDNSITSNNVWSAEKINSLLTGSSFQTYKIRLNSGSTVLQRITGLVEGVDYPVGWVLMADNAALIIKHNLNTLSTVVSVFSVNGVTNDAVKLEGNVAYSTFTNKWVDGGYNAIRLDAFATINTEIIIKIVL